MTKNVNRNFLIEKDEILLEIALVLYVFAQVFEMTVFSLNSDGTNNQILFSMMKVMRYTAYGLCVIRIFMKQKVKLKWFMCVIAVLAVLLVGALVADSRTMFLCFWLVAASYGVSDKKILRTVMYTQIIILAITVLCSQIGIVEDVIYGDRMRHYLGFTWTTTAPILFFYIVLQYLYICELNISLLQFVLLMSLNVWFYLMTNTRFTFVLLSMTLIFAFLYKRTFIKKLRLNKIKYLFIWSPEIIGGFSILLHAVYNSNSPVWNMLNSFLSGRLKLGYNAIQQYGINLFGHQLSWYGNGLRSQVGQNGIVYNYVDCSYLQILLEYGLVFLILVLAAYSYIMFKAIKEKRYSACWVILMVLIFGITEPRLVNFAFNPFVLLLFAKAEVSNIKCFRIKSPVVFRINKDSSREEATTTQ